MTAKKKTAKKAAVKKIALVPSVNDSNKGEPMMAVPVVEVKPVDSTNEIVVRLKSFAWRALGMAVVAGLTYVLGLGSVWLVNPKTLVDIVVMVLAGLVVGEITKYYNNKTAE